MKTFVLLSLTFSFTALAQMPKMADIVSKGKDLSAKVMAACKEDKSKIKGCDSYTELDPLKECHIKNKRTLSHIC